MDAVPVEALSQAKRYQIIPLFGAVGPLVCAIAARLLKLDLRSAAA